MRQLENNTFFQNPKFARQEVAPYVQVPNNGLNFKNLIINSDVNSHQTNQTATMSMLSPRDQLSIDQVRPSVFSQPEMNGAEFNQLDQNYRECWELLQQLKKSQDGSSRAETMVSHPSLQIASFQ